MTHVIGVIDGATVVSVDPDTHLVVERSEVAGIQAVLPQLALVLAMTEREFGISDALAFECRAARAMLAEHFPQIELPDPPEQE